MKKRITKIGIGIAMAVVVFGSVAAEATVIFNDTFDWAGALQSDINTNYVARQAAGTTTSTYTKGGDPQSYLQDNDPAFASDVLLLRVYESTNSMVHQIDLDADFGSSLVGNVWSLSYRERVAASTAYSGWSGFSVGNAPNTPNNVTAGFGINIFNSGIAQLWSRGVNIGSANVGNITGVLFDLTAVFDEGAGTVSLTFVSASTNINMGTFNIAFQDGVRNVELRSMIAADPAATGTGYVDVRFDDLTIETITVIPPVLYEYAFFDTFDAPNTTDVNTNYVARQANGTVTSTYTEFADGSNLIAGNQLSIIAGGTLTLNTNLAGKMVGQDFKLSIDATMLNTNGNWAAFYVLSANEANRGVARMGFHYWGAPQGTAFTVYSGVGGQVATGVTVAQLTTLFGSAYNREIPHTIQLISTAGPTNTYDFVIDGVVVLNDLPYAFGEDTTRTLQFVATVSPATKGVLYDNLSLSVPAPLATYAQWVTDNNLAGGAALRTADPDVDGMDNLLEYALGGNPNTNDAATVQPVSGIVNVSGTNWFGYVYTRRLDAAVRGLVYGVTLNDTDLVFGTWTNIGTTAEFGTAPINADFESVTNVFSTIEDKKFVSLEVTEN